MIGFLAIAVGLWALRRARLFRVEVEGRSMEPALRRGDYLVATERGHVGRGALVVVGHPETPGFEMVKRVAAVPGDPLHDRVLAEGEYWVVGDNPLESTDSRTFGPIPRGLVRGVVRLRYWPTSRIGWLGCAR